MAVNPVLLVVDTNVLAKNADFVIVVKNLGIWTSLDSGKMLRVFFLEVDSSFDVRK